MNVLLSLLLAISAPPQDVQFPDRAAARKAIVDESVEPYFSLLLPHDMSAKTGRPITGETLEAQRAECRKRYQDAIREFSDAEKRHLRGVVAKLHPHLSAHYPRLAALPWKFLKLETSAEGGLPHTRGDCIVLPSPIAGRAPLPLLVHEQIHVFQRRNPRHADSLYVDLWGFKRAPNLKGGAWLDARTVVNPDAIDLGWAFPAGDRWIWPRVLFARAAKNPDDVLRMPWDFKMAAVELEKTGDGFRVKLDAGGKPVVHDLLGIREYRRAFPGITYIYHPAEAAAKYFDKIIATDLLKPAAASPDLDPVRKWFRKNLR